MATRITTFAVKKATGRHHVGQSRLSFSLLMNEQKYYCCSCRFQSGLVPRNNALTTFFRVSIPSTNNGFRKFSTNHHHEEDYDRWYSHGSCGNVTICHDDDGAFSTIDTLTSDDMLELGESSNSSSSYNNIFNRIAFFYDDEDDHNITHSEDDLYDPFRSFEENYNITDDYIEQEEEYWHLSEEENCSVHDDNDPSIISYWNDKTSS